MFLISLADVQWLWIQKKNGQKQTAYFLRIIHYLRFNNFIFLFIISFQSLLCFSVNILFHRGRMIFEKKTRRKKSFINDSQLVNKKRWKIVVNSKSSLRWWKALKIYSHWIICKLIIIRKEIIFVSRKKI